LPFTRDRVTVDPVETPELTFSATVFIAAAPEKLYDMVSDVTRMGEWSPVCKACWWDEGVTGPAVGAWFTGRNESPDRDPWETRSRVVAAEPGNEFAFVVGGTWTRWGYTFTPADDGTEVTESWEMLTAGLARFDQRFGDNAARELALRAAAARSGIPATLAALKRAAEGR
jgi:hypothetical protein